MTDSAGGAQPWDQDDFRSQERQERKTKPNMQGLGSGLLGGWIGLT